MIRPILLAASIMLAATTAQAQPISCQFQGRDGLPRPFPPLTLMLDIPNHVALSQNGNQWRLETSDSHYRIFRLTDAGQQISMVIERNTGFGSSSVLEPGDKRAPVMSMLCARPNRL